MIRGKRYFRSPETAAALARELLRLMAGDHWMEIDTSSVMVAS